MKTVFRFPTLVRHLVPSSPQDLGFHVPGFWPVGLWGLLQVERPAGSLGSPQVCFNITRFIPHICDTSSGSQKTWPSPGVSWLGAWVALGQRLVLIPCCSSLATQSATAPALSILLGSHRCLGKVY